MTAGTTMDRTASATMDRESLLLLLLLSVLWGTTFFFVAVALHELPPLTIVLVRVVLGAAILWPVLYRAGVELPSTFAGWWPFAVMGLLNNVIPFSLFIAGQTMVTSSLASVLNATAPVFTILVLAAFGEEALSTRRVVGVMTGLVGVVILRGASLQVTGAQTTGMLLCLGAALSYGFSGLWAKRKLAGVPPITSATLQLTCSSIVMTVIALAIDKPWQLPMPGATTWLALVGLAAIATSLAYIIFFRILARSGPANVMLVTLLLPITAILLGHFILGEDLSANEIVGTLVIACALLVIDGRPLAWLRHRAA